MLHSYGSLQAQFFFSAQPIDVADAFAPAIGLDFDGRNAVINLHHDKIEWRSRLTNGYECNVSLADLRTEKNGATNACHVTPTNRAIQGKVGLNYDFNCNRIR